jgi:hypothetical protein
MIFKSLPFDKSSRRIEYFEFLNQPFQVGMIGLVGNMKYYDQEPFFHEWYGVEMLNWIKFNKEKSSVEFYEHQNFYIINNPQHSKQKNYTLPHPRTLMDFLSDLDRCEIETEWSDYVIKNNDIKYILSNSSYKLYIDDLLIRIGKGKGMDSSK